MLNRTSTLVLRAALVLGLAFSLSACGHMGCCKDKDADAEPAAEMQSGDAPAAEAPAAEAPAQ